MKPAQTTELSIPPALMGELQAAAEDEHRPAAEIVRDALEGYLAQSRKGLTSVPIGQDTGKRTPAEAVARLRELRKGNVLPEGVTIRELIDYGRA